MESKFIPPSLVVVLRVTKGTHLMPKLRFFPSFLLQQLFLVPVTIISPPSSAVYIYALLTDWKLILGFIFLKPYKPLFPNLIQLLLLLNSTSSHSCMGCSHLIFHHFGVPLHCFAPIDAKSIDTTSVNLVRLLSDLSSAPGSLSASGSSPTFEASDAPPPPVYPLISLILNPSVLVSVTCEPCDPRDSPWIISRLAVTLFQSSQLWISSLPSFS